jgi:hypothetical protein
MRVVYSRLRVGLQQSSAVMALLLANRQALPPDFEDETDASKAATGSAKQLTP